MGKEKGPGFKLVTNVSEFGLLQPLAKSRLRLFLGTVVANAALFGLTLWVADYITAASTSVGVNLFLITCSMLLLLVASYIEAIADLFFPGRYRERVLLGKKVQIDPESEEALEVSSYKSYNLAFLILLAVVIISNYFGIQAIAGDYLDEYHQIGFHLTRLRSPDGEEKIEALREISKPIYRDLWTDPRLTSALENELDAEDTEVRQWAIWAAGESEMNQFIPKLALQLEAGGSATRAEAAVAMGKMKDKRATAPLVKFLSDSHGDSVRAIGALRALAFLKDPDAGEAVAALLHADDKEVRAHAYWATGKVGYVKAHDLMLRRYQTGTADDKCGALETLKYIVQPDDVQRFKDLFLVLDDKASCQWLIFEDRDLEKHYVIFKESHHVKFMKIVWNGAGEKERNWYAFIAADKEKSYEVRMQATHFLEAIRQMPRRGTRP